MSINISMPKNLVIFFHICLCYNLQLICWHFKKKVGSKKNTEIKYTQYLKIAK